METNKLVSREEWLAARTALLAKEKEFTRRRDEGGMEELPGLSVFYKDEAGNVFHTYSSYARGAEDLITTYMVLDLTPKGRNETGPHHNLMDWVRRHDEYDRPNTPGAE
jgi:predicted dithiol-disulfide oxidoreductase (DUF899 family)